MKTKLFKRMVEKGMTFSQVATKLNIRPLTVLMWCDGRKTPSPRDAKKLAKIFDCKVIDIKE